MTQRRFLILLISYFVLLGATGYLSFCKLSSFSTLPHERSVQLAAAHPEYGDDLMQDLLEEVRGARERRESLAKLASHSFDVVLGALLGFLSALGIGQTASKNGKTSTQSMSSGASGRVNDVRE